MYQNNSGCESTDVEKTLTLLAAKASQLRARGEFAKSLLVANEVRETLEACSRNGLPEYAECLAVMGTLFRELDRLPVAAELLRRSLEIYRVTVGRMCPEYAVTLRALAEVHSASRRDTEARLCLEQAVRASRGSVGRRSSLYRDCLDDLATVYSNQGELERTVALRKKTLALAKGVLDPRDSQFAGYIRRLGCAYWASENWERATVFLEQSVSIDSKSWGKNEGEFARCLYLLGDAYWRMGNVVAAEDKLRECVREAERIAGREHMLFANSLGRLSSFLDSIGKVKEAEAYCMEALSAIRTAIGTKNASYAIQCIDMATLGRKHGNYEGAERMLTATLRLIRNIESEKSQLYANCLCHLTRVYLERRKGGEAVPLARELLRLRREDFGQNSAEYSAVLHDLATAYRMNGRYGRAERLYKASLAIRRKVETEESPSYASTLGSLAVVYRAKGDYTTAGPLFRKTCLVLRRVSGKDCKDHITGLSNYAMFCVSAGQYSRALRLLRGVLRREEMSVVELLPSAGDDNALSLTRNLRKTPDMIISLASTYLANNSDAAAEAFEAVLRRKGIATEAQCLVNREIAKQTDASIVRQWEQVREARTSIVKAALIGCRPENESLLQSKLDARERNVDIMQRELHRHLPRVHLSLEGRKSVSRDVASHLLPGTALVEYVVSREFHFDQPSPSWGKRQYYAFVICPEWRNQVGMFHLGDAREIESCVENVRATYCGAMSGQRGIGVSSVDMNGSPADEARRLRRMVFDPLASSLGHGTHLVLAPDGLLGLIPFAILPKDGGGHLIDDYCISYVGCARELCSPLGHVQRAPTTPPVIVVDPDFDLDRRELVPSSSESVSSYGSDWLGRHESAIQFERLPSSKYEGEAVFATLGSGEIWTGAEALDGKVKALISPIILHLATHAFSLAGQPRCGTSADNSLRPGRAPLRTLHQNAPLIDSGLLLAGVNAWIRGMPQQGNVEDGILTAEDISMMNLSGTELVVLSACDTGLGYVERGEGVFGLRHAFSLAGARTVVASMWPVHDDKTRLMMRIFYEEILAGTPRAVALRKAQLHLKASSAPPADWGAFVCYGDRRPVPPRSE